VQNHSGIAWPGVSFALQNSGGISGASAAFTSDLAANSTTSGMGPITFTAAPTAGLVTATIQVSLCGVVVGNLTFPIYPVVTVSITQQNFQEQTCSGFKFWEQTVVCSIVEAANLCSFGAVTPPLSIDCAIGLPANSYVKLVLSIVGGSPNLFNGNSCTPVSNISSLQGPGCTPITFTAGIQASSAPQQVAILVQPYFMTGNSTSFALPSFQQTITVPAA
jgi:hypothetical protein